jgi:monoamine oxidase
MKEITKEMLRIYKPISNLDWLNYRLIRGQVSYHHCIKRADGGKRTINNGAILMPHAHEYLHIIEYKDIKTYEMINKLFKIINTQLHEPNMEQREIIEYLLLEFEDKHREDLNSKGKILIKDKYLRRWS